ncbi:hypothetical protein [Phocicoccus pinnipedialis]|uniref:Uncharacterized protein n=1 Tax=Phocicoccus pinnipedialis TaxID=110845 RepID=A0A6V7RCH7_9BACL|nr:hypothetical protein [Jeotgalicoccus pinnipedialis]MBP1939556.1 vacuolar-type H+-ATPase subunit E/Vma4 [Jeotgalicoccus pinnipedialis]CAD2074959.1 hypothetical protein JEOPIN946_00883 [Jeotgalicoccus pinnipedialis]
MKNFFKNVVKVGALFAVGLGVKKLSENREAVKQELEKAKNDPKGYAKSVQSMATQKAEEVSEQAKSEVEKAKNDPKGYAEDVKSKAVDKAKYVQADAKTKAEEFKANATAEFENLKQQGKVKVEEAKAKVDKVKDKSDDTYTTPDTDVNLNEKVEKQTLANEGGLTEGEVKKVQEKALDADVDVVDDQANKDENYNVHVVTDDK